MNSPRLAAAADAASVDLNSDVCRVCGEPGTLVCCDLCTNAYHLTCARLQEVPEVSGWRSRRRRALLSHGGDLG